MVSAFEGNKAETKTSKRSTVPAYLRTSVAAVRCQESWD